MIDVVDLAFAYGDGGFRLNVKRFHAEPGERVALIGPSGSGKTTLLHLLAGIRVPAAGQVTVLNSRLDAHSSAWCRHLRLRRIGLIFQEFELLEYLSVRENILIACRLGSGLRVTRELRLAAEALATSVGLGDKLSRYPNELSQGEKQRVAACRALLLDPTLLLADEPTGNLDPANKQRMLDLLMAQTRARSATLVVATHDHQLLDRFDRTVDMQEIATWTQSGQSPSLDAST